MEVTPDNPAPITGSISGNVSSTLSNTSVAVLATAIGTAVVSALLAAAILAPLNVSVKNTSIPVTFPTPFAVTIPTPVPVTQPTYTAQVTTSANITTVSVQVVASNSARRGFLLWDNSANSAYCCFAATCTSAAPANIVATFTSWVYVLPYTGPISYIRNSGSGTVTVTELI